MQQVRRLSRKRNTPTTSEIVENKPPKTLRPRLQSTAALVVAAIAGLAGVARAANDTADNVLAGAGTDLGVGNATNYSTGALPLTTNDMVFTNGTYTNNSAFTLTSSAISPATLDDLDTTQAITVAGPDSITLNGGGTDVATGASGSDVQFVASGGSLTVNAPVVLAATGSFDIAGAAAIGGSISGTTFGFTKSGAGLLILSASNGYTGGTTISAGTLRLTNINAVQGSAVTNSGTLDLRSNTSVSFATGGVTLNSGTINVDNNGSGTGQTLTLGGAISLPNATTSINVTSGGGYTLALGTVSAGGANGGQTFNTLGANLSIATYNGSGGGDQSLNLNGSGNFTFGSLENGGANREINPTVNTSGTVTINGSTSSNINNDTASNNNADVNMNNGTLVLDFSNLATPTNLITRSGTHSTTFFYFGGGALSIYGKTGSTATSQNLFGGTTFNAGASAISITNNGSSTTTLTLNSITRNVGGTVDFSSPSGTTFGTKGLVTTTDTINVGGILGGYATVGGSTWAVAPGSSGGAITGLATGNYYNTNTTGALSAASSTANIDVAAAGTNASATSQVVNSLRFNDSSGAATVDATNGLTLTSGGILVTSNVGNHLSTIANGTIAGANATDLVVIQNNTANGLTISSTIANDTGATALTKSGPGLLTLSNAANTYTGVTYLNAGTVNIAADASLGTAPGSATAAQLTVNGGALQFASSFNLATNRGITLGYKGGTIDTNGFNTSYGGIVAGVSSVNGALTKTGPGMLTLSGANTYSAGTVINGGTLTVSSGSAGSLNGTTGTPLAFGGTGVFNVDEAASSNQGMGTLTLSAGDATVQSTFVGTAATLTFSQMPTPTVGATGNFVDNGGSATTNKIVLTNFAGGTTPTGTLLSPALFYGGSSYAAYNATTGYVRAYGSGDTGYVGAAALTTSNTTTASNVTLTGAGTSAGGTNINTVTMAGNNLSVTGTFETNGILVSGGTANTIGGGTSLSTTTSGAQMVVRTNLSSDALTISTPIVDNSGTALTKSGAGLLTLTAANTYTGATFINAGTLTLDSTQGSGNASLVSTYAVSLGGGAELRLLSSTGTNTTMINPNAYLYVSSSSGTPDIQLDVHSASASQSVFALIYNGAVQPIGLYSSTSEPTGATIPLSDFGTSANGGGELDVTSVPEPTSLGLLGLAGLGMMRRRRPSKIRVQR